jgi:DNA-binding transcriptional LysR family regulator
VNTTFLETLVRIAAVGSFRQAAEQLGATQAAVSQRIATLEDELDARLVERGPRPVRLTAAGERILPIAERMLALEAELKSRARPGAAPAGRVRVGAIESVVHTWLTKLIRRVAERAPAVELDLTVDTARNLRERFYKRDLQLIFQNDPLEAAGIDDAWTQPLCRFPMRWIGRPGELPVRPLSLSELARMPLITFSARSSPHLQLRALFQAEGLEPRITCCPSVAGIIKLVLDGFGVAVVPPLFLRSALQRKRLRLYAGPKLPGLRISVAHAALPSAAERLVVAEAQQVVAEYCLEAGTRWARALGDAPR